MEFWLPLFFSLMALLASGLCVAVAVSLAKRSPPGIVARAAAEVEAVESDLVARLRAMKVDIDGRMTELETKLDGTVIHVENVLEEVEKYSSDATKRNRGARRAQQAAEEAARKQNGGHGAPTTLDQLPIGHPGRIAAIEETARRNGW